MANINNLYPPIIDTYMPAFIRTTKCRVYFSLSRYNNFNDISSCAQVSLKNQNSNITALKKSLYPNGIKFCDVNIDSSIIGDDKYYIELFASDLESGFELNQYYKVQIRFTSSTISRPSADNEAQWLIDNTKYFSEWSKVCLIQGIGKPKIVLYNFKDVIEDNTSVSFNSNTIDLNGEVQFEEGDKETLKSYRIKLYNTNEEVLLDSGDVYANTYNNINQINYQLKYHLLDGNSYKIKVDITTKNLYQDSIEHTFSIIESGLDKINADVFVNENYEKGSIIVNIKGKTEDPFIGNITIRRTSSKTDFTIWEDVHTESVETNQKLDLYWEDKTIESGIWYKYCAQRRDSLGNRGVIVTHAKPIMVLFDDMFLIKGGMSLRIRCNTNVNSFKRNVLESKTDTIGSQFPFIGRNGYVNYREFPLSGLITIVNDHLNDFTSREELLGKESLSFYEEFNDKNRISWINDSVVERIFREKVMDFLYSKEPMLFKTLTEGNIIIKLMSVSLTPEQVTGRHLYSFSATAYEIDDCTVDNIDKYNIQPIGSYDKVLLFNSDKIGQINDIFKAGKANDVVANLLVKKYNKPSEKPNFKQELKYLDYVKIEFLDAPYLIKEENGQLIKTDELNESIIGHIVYINNTPIVVPNNEYYELKGDDIEITSIYFPYDTKATIDYLVNLDEKEDVSKLYKTAYYYPRVGQIIGNYKYKESVFNKIWAKYYYDYTDSFRRLISISGIDIEANPNTVVYIKEQKDTEVNRHVINDNCFLRIHDEDSAIEGIYFCGVHLEEASDIEKQNGRVPANKYINTGLTYSKFEDVRKPIYNGVYVFTDEEVNNQNFSSIIYSDRLYQNLIKDEMTSNTYIYYNGKWEPFSNGGDVLCAVDAIVNYYGDIMEGDYFV